MKKDDRNEQDPLERNMERLLSEVRPELTMPEAAKNRVLTALKALQEEPSPVLQPKIKGGFAMLMKSRVFYPMAAAVAVILAVIFFWPGATTGGIAWADVVKQIESVQTMTGLFTVEEIGPSGERRITRSKLYYKDPARARYDTYRASGGKVPGAVPSGEEIELIRITVGSRDRSVQIHLNPMRKTGDRTVTSYGGTLLEKREDSVLDMAGLSWLKLKEVASDRAREIGERSEGGIPMVGFESPMREVFPPSSRPPEGTLRVWVDRESAVPIEVEADFKRGAGFRSEARLDNIEWNVPLADDLFGEGSFEGFEIRESKVELFGFRKTLLKPHVTLRLGLEDAEPVLTERDIAEVRSGEAASESPEGGWDQVRIFIVLTEEGGKRAWSFTKKHLGEWAVLDFDGRIRTRLKIAGVIGREMQIDITSLGLSLDQFESQYLTGNNQ